MGSKSLYSVVFVSILLESLLTLFLLYSNREEDLDSKRVFLTNLKSNYGYDGLLDKIRKSQPDSSSKLAPTVVTGSFSRTVTYSRHGSRSWKSSPRRLRFVPIQTSVFGSRQIQQTDSQSVSFSVLTRSLPNPHRVCS